MGIYDFVVKTNKGVEKSLADYKGKVLVIVNTASKCGFTPQFKETAGSLYEIQGPGPGNLRLPLQSVRWSGTWQQ